MRYLLHQAISEFAEKIPEKDAFRIHGKGLSYRELETASDCLANWLRANGLERGDRVGLFLTKSLELPVAIYGILKAGGVYVPIDPSAPKSRIQFIVEDCGIEILVSNGPKNAFLKRNGVSGLRLVVGGMEEDSWNETKVVSWRTLRAGEEVFAKLTLTDQDLAYIIYTSGSTGVPKGLMHTHRSGLAYVEMSAELYGVGEEAKLGNHSPLHFDMSTFEYLTAPNRGATTVMIPEEAMLFPVEVVSLIKEEELTHWYSVPLALIQLLERGGIENEVDFDSMRWVLFGGEPFAPKYLNRLRKLWPQANFSNSYGPAEVNQCTFFHVRSGEETSNEPLPLGQGCQNFQLKVLDEREDFVSEGRGELLVRTSSMMQGYWNRADLNEMAFYREERVAGYGEIYYRTGDLVSVDENGVFHFLGRKDRQVKIRGYRLELDEVEKLFGGLEEVEEAAVVFGTVSDREPGVFAAVTVCQEEVTAVDLRRRVKELLPSYGVPEVIEIWERFPRTGSGKIDRREVKKLLLEPN